jgi:tautomerase-like protein
MPLIRIDLDDSISLEVREAIGEGLHAALVDALDEVPDEDDFQIMTVHPPGELRFHRSYAGRGAAVQRDRVIYIEILIDGFHDRDVKRKLYANIAQELGAAGIKPDEVFVALSSNGPDDWWAGSTPDPLEDDDEDRLETVQ